jgi:8-oxo-dGTP diphosphatase
MADTGSVRDSSPVDVVAACLLDAGHVLAVERAGGGWEFPGGKVEPGEDHATALRRELGEELLIEAAIGTHLVTVEHNQPGFPLRLHCYLATAQGPITLTEHRAARWLTRATLDEPDWLPADRLVLPHISPHLIPDDPRRAVTCRRRHAGRTVEE